MPHSAFINVAAIISVTPTICNGFNGCCSNTVAKIIAVKGSTMVKTEALVALSFFKAFIYRKNGTIVPSRLNPNTNNNEVFDKLNKVTYA